MSKYGVCPDCGEDALQRVRYNWWGGLLGPLLFKQVECGGCKAHYYIKAVRSRIWRFLKWGFLGLIFLPIVFVVYIAAAGPDTRVLPGRQVPAKFASRIRDLDLLEPDEKVLYFYSDALVDIDNGFYVLTDRKVIVYSSSFEEPAILVPYSQIVKVDAAFAEGWGENSVFTLTLDDRTTVVFPAATEGGGDRLMHDALLREVAEKGVLWEPEPELEPETGPES